MKDLFKDIRETVATSVKDATKAPGNGDGEGEHVPEEECKAKDECNFGPAEIRAFEIDVKKEQEYFDNIVEYANEFFAEKNAL